MIPLVTAGMPVFNGNPLFAKAIQSILGQTYRNIEVVVSDNASTDDTPGLIEKFAQGDARINKFRQSHVLSVWENYRFVLEQGHGEYFFWAPHDDFWDSRFVEIAVDALESQPDAIAAIGMTRSVDNAGVVRIIHSDPYELDIADRHTRIRSYVNRTVPDVLIYAVFRRQALLGTIWSHSTLPEKVILMHALLQGRVLDCPGMIYYNYYVPKTKSDVAAMIGLSNYSIGHESRVFVDVVKELYRGSSPAEFLRLLPHVVIGQRWHRFFAKAIFEKAGLIQRKS